MSLGFVSCVVGESHSEVYLHWESDGALNAKIVTTADTYYIEVSRRITTLTTCRCDALLCVCMCGAQCCTTRLCGRQCKTSFELESQLTGAALTAAKFSLNPQF